MLSVGRALVEEAAPGAATQYGYHLPPFNSVDHVHLHCFALPFAPAWKEWKYKSPAACHLWYLPAEVLLQVRASGRVCASCCERQSARAAAPDSGPRLARAAAQRLGATRGGGAAGGAHGGYGALDDKSVP
jgi:hypothetical protein